MTHLVIHGKKSRNCNKASTYGYSDSQISALYESCPAACGMCIPNSCINDDLFTDYFGYHCSDWKKYNCTKASSEFGYSVIHEGLIVEHCPSACQLCDDKTDLACQYPFADDSGILRQGSIWKNGSIQCKTPLGNWKQRVPAGTQCVFPFIYFGMKYYSCTIDDTDSTYPWCATKVDDHGEYIPGHWAKCSGQSCSRLKTIKVGKCDPDAIATKAANDNSANHAEDADDRGMGDMSDSTATTTTTTTTTVYVNNGMGDNEDGMGDNEDGMGDNEDGMSDNMGRRERRGERRARSDTAKRPEWVSCNPAYLTRFDPKSPSDRKVHILDQYDSPPSSPSSWKKFVHNKPVFATVVALSVIVIAIGSTVFGRWFIKRRADSVSGPGWKKFKVRLNRYGTHQMLQNTNDPFNG